MSPKLHVQLLIALSCSFALQACDRGETADGPDMTGHEASESANAGEGSDGAADDEDADTDDEGGDDKNDEAGGGEDGDDGAMENDGDSGNEDEGSDSDSDEGENEGGDGEEGGDEDDDHDFLGNCGVELNGMADPESFEAELTYWITADRGAGDRVCEISVKVSWVATYDQECEVFGVPCEWAHEVMTSEAKITLDPEGYCADSEVAWDAEKIEALGGRSMTWAYVPEVGGHEKAVVELNEDGVWEILAQGDWKAETGKVYFTKSEGFCGFGF